jgi:hypothetical protein
MEFASFDISVKDLSTRNVITRCNSSRPLYTKCLPSHPAPSSPTSAPSALLHQRLFGIDISATRVSTSYLNYLMILVSFALAALTTFAMLVS